LDGWPGDCGRKEPAGRRLCRATHHLAWAKAKRFLIEPGVFGCLVLARRAAQELPVCVSHRIWKLTPRPSKARRSTHGVSGNFGG
jgi:hypothetical protein